MFKTLKHALLINVLANISNKISHVPTQKLVFHGNRKRFAKTDNRLEFDPKRTINLIEDFKSGKIKELNVLIKNCTGWSIDVENPENYEIVFLDCENISEGILEQARGRIRIIHK